MNAISRNFRTWLLAQRIRKARVSTLDDAHYRIDLGVAVAEVNIYPYQNDEEIAEYRITHMSDESVVFFLHVLLDDLARAKELFYEMAEALEDIAQHATTRVLLCCTSALTTTLFASKMNEVATALSLDYEFSAMSADRALATREPYAAILLAPQASHLRAQMVEAHPDALVFQIPGKVFGAYDAAGAVRLVMHAFRDADGQEERKTLRAVRDLSNRRKIMVITLFSLRRYARLGYRVYDHGEVVSQGVVRKARFDLRDIEDMLATMGARGIDVRELDAIGIAVPGVTYRGTVTLPNLISETYNLREHIERHFGVTTYVDNNCNAAAVGCYVTQREFENVMFIRQELGHLAGGLGTVIDGTLLKGRRNLAGEITHFERGFAYGTSYDDARWNEDGLFAIAYNLSMTAMSLIAPDVIYLAVDTVDDMDKLHAAMAAELGEEFVPKLVAVDDYVERVYLGDMALCLQKLSDPEYRSLGIS